jgi:hypothetical protein
MSRSEARRRRLGWAVNIGLRILIVGLAIEATAAGDDPRFTGKGIAVRDLILAGVALSLVIPAAHVARRGRRPYPLLTDTLLLSVMALDMTGNHFALYDAPWRFDLVAHGYGPAAAAVALASNGVSWAASVLAVNLGHVLLEIQEAAGDVFFGTSNVRGVLDTVTDLAAGAVTTASLWWLSRARRRTLSAMLDG